MSKKNDVQPEPEPQPIDQIEAVQDPEATVPLDEVHPAAEDQPDPAEDEVVSPANDAGVETDDGGR